MTIGKRIRDLRRNRGWSQEELGKRIGAIRSHVSKWESGRIDPSATNLVRLSRIFGVSVSYLCEGIGVSRSSDGRIESVNDFSETVLELAAELNEADKKHPGMALGFLLLLREGLLDTPEDAQDLLSLLEIYQRRARKE